MSNVVLGNFKSLRKYHYYYVHFTKEKLRHRQGTCPKRCKEVASQDMNLMKFGSRDIVHYPFSFLNPIG